MAGLRHRWIRIAFLCVLSVLTQRVVTAQDDRLLFDRISVPEGLSQSTVFCILQDRQGYLWFGTQDGLNKYDGYGFTIYRPAPLDPHTLTTKTVQALLETRDGALWVATEAGGLHRLARATGRFTRFRHDPDDPNSLSSDDVFTLFEDPGGRLWVGTSAGGLDRYDPAAGQFTHFPNTAHVDERADPRPWSMTLSERADGAFWVGTDGAGLNTFDPATGRFAPLLFDPADPATDVFGTILDHVVDDGGTLWLATPNGLVHYNPATLQTTRHTHDPADPNTLSDDLVFSLEAVPEGALWIGTAAGLNRYDPATARFTRHQHDADDPRSLADDVVFDLYRDRTGRLWAGTETGGVNRLAHEKRRFSIYRHLPYDANTLNASDILSVFEAADGIVWVGTEAGGLNRIDPVTGLVTRFPPTPDRPDGLPSGPVAVIHASPRSTEVLWLGMPGNGLVRFDPATGRTKRYAPPDNPSTEIPGALNNPYVQAILEDRRGRLWLGTGDGGLNLFDPTTEQATAFVHADEALLDYDVIFDLHQDQAGAIWAATLQGVSRFDPVSKTFDYITHDPSDPDGLRSNFVLALHQDTDGVFWLGTESGLHRMTAPMDGTPPTFKVYTTLEGLANDVIYAILDDDDGNLWMSTNRGVSMFDPSVGTFRNYDLHDGLASLEYNQGAFHRGASGILYFGGINGLTVVHPYRRDADPPPPPVVITRFSRFDEVVRPEVPAGETLTLRHTDNFFAFEFAALDFTNPSKNRFSYRMEDLDPGWIDAGTRHYAAYTNVAPGRYTFRVRGANSDGVWNDEGTAVNIVILPPFWQTWWFRLVAMGTVLGLGTVAALTWHRRRIRSVEQQRDEKIEIQRRIADRLESERLHFARELHDGPIQTLQFAGFQLKQLSDSVEDEEGQGTLTQLRATMQDVMLTLRGICGNLRPPALVHFGLARAIRSHADQFLENHPKIGIALDLDEDEGTLPGRIRLGLFRIYQEALNNTAHHAGPCTVQVDLRLTEEDVTLTIEDDGQGFVMPERWAVLAAQQHYGLLGAAERAEALGGRLHVQSAPGYGTRLRVEAPLHGEAASQAPLSAGPS